MASKGGKRPSVADVAKALIAGLNAGCTQCSGEFPREGPVKIHFCKGDQPETVTALEGWVEKRNARSS